MATDALVRSCTSRRVEFIFRMMTVRVVVVVSLCGADMIFGSDFFVGQWCHGLFGEYAPVVFCFWNDTDSLR